MILITVLISCKSKNYGVVGGTSVQFVEIPSTDLVYDINTKIVYLAEITYGSNYVHSAFFASNGLPYKYNVELNELEEIIEN
jgi:hypothetical protein